jgi:bacterioferritin (cytochrome b1)
MSDEGVTNHSGEPGAEGEPGKYTLAEFVTLINEDLQNEWTHLQFYLYHASAVTGLHAEEYKEFLTEAAKGELNHVQQFLDCLYGFDFVQPCAGGHPFATYTRVEDILIEAHTLERQVVVNYAKRLEQLKSLDDKVAAAYLEVFYEDHLQDSFEDARHIQRILADVDKRQARKLNNMDTRS